MLATHIILTVQAWSKGWRGWSLLPGGIVLLIIQLTAAVVSDRALVDMVSWLGNLVCVGILSVLAIYSPQGATVAAKPHEETGAGNTVSRQVSMSTHRTRVTVRRAVTSRLKCQSSNSARTVAQLDEAATRWPWAALVSTLPSVEIPMKQGRLLCQTVKEKE
jgi:hypothetical protein